MKNKFIYDLKNKVKLNVKGKNINRFIVRLHSNGIEILKCNYIDKDEFNIVIYESDYESVLKLKTIYNVGLLDSYGLIRIRKKMFLNRYLIFCIFLGFFLFKVLTCFIFSVEIIDNDSEMVSFLRSELSNYGVKEKTFRKNYHELESIKNDLINRYRDRIEWLEIEVKGTKYIVRLEKRIIMDKPDVLPNRDIVAKKDAIIKDVRAEQGQIVREINSYVKKGDIVISGNIMDNDVIKSTVPAKGEVYGEVWYEISVTYPFVYQETKELGNKKNVFVFKFLNKDIELFDRNKFKTKKVDDKKIISNVLLPISLVRQTQIETEEIEQLLTIDEAIKKAEERGVEKVKDNLREHEFIMNYKVLSTNIRENELELSMFFSVYENITDYKNIVFDE